MSAIILAKQVKEAHYAPESAPMSVPILIKETSKDSMMGTNELGSPGPAGSPVANLFLKSVKINMPEICPVS